MPYKLIFPYLISIQNYKFFQYKLYIIECEIKIL